MNKRFFTTRRILAAATLLVAAGVATVILHGAQDELIIRTGQVEAREIDIASKIPGRVEWIHAREGDQVSAGQELAKLTDREIRARVAQAQGATDAARAQWSMAMSGARKEQIDMAQRQFAAAKSQSDLAERTMKRMKALHNDSLISNQEYEVIEQKYRAALAATEAAAAQRDMAIAGSRSEEKAMARGQFDRAANSLEEANAFMDESILSSPINATIAKRYVDPGEMVSAGYPLLTLIDLDDIWIELNLPETELSGLRVGSKVNGTIPALDRRLQFRVEYIAVMPDFANWRAQNDRGTFEVRSFTVTLRPARTVADLRPGMTVNIEMPER